MSSILITGCAGFIGNAMTRALQEKTPLHTLIGIDNLSTSSKASIPDNIHFYQGSITDEHILEQLFQTHQPDYIFHFAALPRVSYSVAHPIETTHVNTLGTLQLLEAARRHGSKRFILASSSAIYGNPTILPTPEAAPADPQSPYAFQKLHSEQYCALYSRDYGVDTVCLRYFNVYGPGDNGSAPYSTVIAAWLRGLYIDHHTAFLEGDGSQSRDFCYIDDVVQANLLAMQTAQPLNGQVINIASGTTTSLNTLRQHIETIAGLPLQLQARPSRPQDVQTTHADIRRAQTLLGYQPSTSLETGLRHTIQWFQEHSSS